MKETLDQALYKVKYMANKHKKKLNILGQLKK